MNHVDYYDSGYRVIAIHSVTGGVCTCHNAEQCEMQYKHPKMKAWQHTPMWSEEQFDNMCTFGMFDQSFGVICDSLLVVDIDPKNDGIDGMSALNEVLGYDVREKAKLTVKTGGGGWHCYFKCEEIDLCQTVKRFKGIDFKTTGFVVGASSMHKSGMTYEVQHGHIDDIEDAPVELVSLLRKSKKIDSFSAMEGDDISIDEIKEMLTYIDPDITHEDWVNVGFAIHDATKGSNDGFDAWDFWSSKGSKYNEKEMIKKWDSFSEGGGVTIGTLKQMAQENGYVESVTFDDECQDDLNNAAEEAKEAKEVRQEAEKALTLESRLKPINLQKPPGFVGELAEWIEDNNRFNKPQLSVGAAFSAMSTICYRYRTDEGTSPNLMTFNISASATGKEAIQQCAKEIMITAGMGLCSYGAIKSHKEVIKAMISHQVVSYTIDEFGLMLKSIAGGNKSYHDGTIGELMSSFTKASGYYSLEHDLIKSEISAMQNRINAMQETHEENGKGGEFIPPEHLTSMLNDLMNGVIKDPYITLAGYTTGSTFDDLMTEEQASSGFIGRALIFHDADSHPRAKRPWRKTPMTQQMAMKIKEICQNGECGYDKRIMCTDYGIVKVDDACEGTMYDIDDYLYDLGAYHEEATGQHAIVRRAFENVMKVAMLLAIGDGGIIKEHHLLYGLKTIKRDVDAKISRVQIDINKGKKETVKDALLAKIKVKLSSTPKSASVLRNETVLRKYAKEQITAILDELVRRNEADFETSKTGVKKYFKRD